MLFADLPIPAAPPEAPRKPPRRRGVVDAVKRWLQLALDFDFRDLGQPRQADAFLDDEDTAFDFPLHRRAVAGREPPPKTQAPASIWAFAQHVKAAPRPTRKAPERNCTAEGPLYRVEREADRVRVVRLRPEETEERIERERARRAKQRPPKPTKAARTRGAKVRKWDGEVVE